MSTKKSLILLVDDDPDIINLLSKHISTKLPSYSVLSAENGKEGLKKIQSKKPNLVICDIEMPEMNGLDLLETIRGMSDEYYKTLPFIILTIRNDEESLGRVISDPYSMYTSKSYHKSNDLINYISNLTKL